MRMQGVWALALMLASPMARADQASPTSCSGPQLTVDTRLATQQRWRNAVERAQARMKAQRDLDRCASLDLVRSPGGATVRAKLPDGRIAERTLSSPDELPKTVTALV